MQSGPSSPARRVLAVDDDPISLAITAVLLEGEGCVVQQAQSGAQAVDLAASNPPDCILADLRMPGLNSTELARSLRKAAPQALLLAMSATPPPQLEGYDGILKKPLSPESLRAAFAGRAAAGNGSPPARRASHDPKEDAVLDAEIFERLRRAITPDGLDEVFTVFIKDTHDRIAVMRSADPATVRREAHTIKGGASMVGALQISRAAAAIESGIDDPDDRLRKLDEMEAQCRFAAIILRQRLKA
ncbi:MAG: response regulator [Acidobacteriaceae bacterium]|jgi:CheY-like chemotaxis protein/HPt (histidine-containing phosphotransfer) domain-containing protein